MSEASENQHLRHPQDSPMQGVNLVAAITQETAFWRPEPLTSKERRLLAAVLVTQGRIAQREDICASVVKLAAKGSCNYPAAIASGILSLGGFSSPLSHAMAILNAANIEEHVPEIVARNERIPGFGSVIYKGRPDPDLAEIREVFAQTFPEMLTRIDAIEAALHVCGKSVYANDAIYTAAACLILRMPADFAPYFIILGRLGGWTETAFNYTIRS